MEYAFLLMLEGSTTTLVDTSSINWNSCFCLPVDLTLASALAEKLNAKFSYLCKQT
jgi:hypothetical protein